MSRPQISSLIEFGLAAVLNFWARTQAEGPGQRRWVCSPAHPSPGICRRRTRSPELCLVSTCHQKGERGVCILEENSQCANPCSDPWS